MMQDVHKLSHVTISNTTLTPLNFRLMTQAPFHIVQMDRIRERPRVILQQTPMSSLEPRQNMLVKILFFSTRCTPQALTRPNIPKKKNAIYR